MTDVMLRPPQSRPGQRASHRGLLACEFHSPGRARIDAMIVPAARGADRLRSAAQLAAILDCPLVALCSHQAEAVTIRETVWTSPVEVIAADVHDATTLPGFHTTRLLAGSRFRRAADTPLKRNLGLALTRMTGWQRVLFLDDDIAGLSGEVIERAAGLLDRYDVVAMDNVGFPDNSVVCHAHRAVGADQGTFVGAGALLFPGSRASSFFPNIYNEDWFFLLNEDSLSRVAVHGTFAQNPFDPYANPGRAGSEEFGDCLAEGIFALLDDGRRIADADQGYWAAFLEHRRDLNRRIIERVRTAPMSNPRREQVVAALRAAADNLRRITPVLCADYLDAWRYDRMVWQRYIDDLPRDLTPAQALGVLGLDPHPAGTNVTRPG